MKTARSIEEARESQGDATPVRKYGRGEHPNSLKNLEIAKFKPGEVHNPTGYNGDKARDLARAIFLQNEELIYQAFARALGKGNAYAFEVLAKRAFGDVAQKLELSGMEGLAERVAKRRK